MKLELQLRNCNVLQSAFVTEQKTSRMLVPTLASARTTTNSSGLSLLILFSSMSAVWRNNTIRNNLELDHGQNQGGSTRTYHDLELEPHLLQDVLPRHRRRPQDQLRRDENSQRGGGTER
jgi:hypothetical protein